MKKKNRQEILESHGWDVFENIDGFFSAEKDKMIIEGRTISLLYEECRKIDLDTIAYKILTGDKLNKWEKRLIKVNKNMNI